jgi:hypothetical protein
MNRKFEHDDLIELGAASVATKGTPVGMDDSQGGLNPWAGLSDE